MKTKILPLILTLLFPGLGLQAQTLTFDFSVNEQGFAGGVSDFGLNQSDQHHFTFDNRILPSPLDTTHNAQFMGGINPSDDLFMFMKRRVTGLQPNTSYQIIFVVEFASIYPTNAIGVGGPPGEGVTMKAGFTLIEPDTMIIEKGGPYVAMNIDKGNQSTPGVDMDTIGHVGVSDTTTVYTFKTNDNIGHPFSFTTNSTGEGWVIIGTDSGFEAETALYFSRITVDFTVSTSSDHVLHSNDIQVYPNPSSGTVYVSSAEKEFEMIRIFDTSGRLYRSYLVRGTDVAFYLPRSEYLVKISSGDSTVVKRVIVQ